APGSWVFSSQCSRVREGVRFYVSRLRRRIESCKRRKISGAACTKVTVRTTASRKGSRTNRAKSNDVVTFRWLRCMVDIGNNCRRPSIASFVVTKRGIKSERIRQSLADWSSPATREDSVFLWQHDYWIIRYHGFTALLKSTRGLYYLAVMLRDPGREFHVLELVAYAMHASSLAAAVAAKGRVS